MSNLSLDAFTTEDGLLWAAFVYGHHALDVVKSEAVLAMLTAHIETACCIDHDEAREHLADREPGQLWIYDAYEAEETGDPDFPWRFCEAGHAGAIAITGWRFT